MTVKEQKTQLLEQLTWYEDYRKRIHKWYFKLLKESRDAALIFQIQNYITKGYDIDDKICKIITYLIGEYGEGLFTSEQLMYFLKKEEIDYEDKQEVDYQEYAEAFPDNLEYQKLANQQLLNS